MTATNDKLFRTENPWRNHSLFKKTGLTEKRI